MLDGPACIRLIHRTIQEARQAGADYLGQTQRAVAAVLAVRPDMTASEAMTLVERMRER